MIELAVMIFINFITVEGVIGCMILSGGLGPGLGRKPRWKLPEREGKASTTADQEKLKG
jgi:hypothetical protein